jgi:hypothetical protein
MPMLVMPALVAGIHVFGEVQTKTWMAGSSPAMTPLNFVSAKCPSVPEKSLAANPRQRWFRLI